MTTPQIQTIIEHSQAVTDAPDRYGIAVGQVVKYLAARAGKPRADIEKEAGLRPGIITILCGGHYGGLADDAAWIAALDAFGFPSRVVYADGFQWSRLLGDLAIWRLWKDEGPDSGSSDYVIRKLGYTWASLAKSISGWGSGDLDSGGAILDHLFGADVDHEANSQAFLDLTERWYTIHPEKLEGLD